MNGETLPLFRDLTPPAPAEVSRLQSVQSESVQSESARSESAQTKNVQVENVQLENVQTENVQMEIEDTGCTAGAMPRTAAPASQDTDDRFFATACALAAALKEQSDRAAAMDSAGGKNNSRRRKTRAGRPATQAARAIDPQRRIGSAICENLLASLHAQVAREARSLAPHQL